MSLSRAASGCVCPVGNAMESFIVGTVVSQSPQPQQETLGYQPTRRFYPERPAVHAPSHAAGPTAGHGMISAVGCAGPVESTAAGPSADPFRLGQLGRGLGAGHGGRTAQSNLADDGGQETGSGQPQPRPLAEMSVKRDAQDWAECQT